MKGGLRGFGVFSVLSSIIVYYREGGLTGSGNLGLGGREGVTGFELISPRIQGYQTYC